jgi:hypothetical protein
MDCKPEEEEEEEEKKKKKKNAKEKKERKDCDLLHDRPLLPSGMTSTEQTKPNLVMSSTGSQGQDGLTVSCKVTLIPTLTSGFLKTGACINQFLCPDKQKLQIISSCNLSLLFLVATSQNSHVAFLTVSRADRSLRGHARTHAPRTQVKDVV